MRQPWPHKEVADASNHNAVRLFGVLMPATAALLLTARTGGRAAVQRLLGRLAIWRVGWLWWAAAVLVQPAALVITGLVYNGLGGQPPVTPAPLVSVSALIVNVILLALATLGEEMDGAGWYCRGVGARHPGPPLLGTRTSESKPTVA